MNDGNIPTVLIVEDDVGVSHLEQRRLEKAGYGVLTAANPDEALERLAESKVALVLLDYRLPGDTDGLAFYSQIKDAGFDLPVILVTGFGNEAAVIRALRLGIRDFVTKSVEYLDYLPEAVERVLKQVQTENQLAESEARSTAVIDSAMDAILTVEADGRIGLFNTAAEQIFRCRAAQAVDQPITRFMPLVPWEMPKSTLGRGPQITEESFSISLRSQTLGRRADGEEFPLEASVTRVEVPGRKFYTLMVRDIAERKRAEVALRDSEQRYKRLLESITDYIYSVQVENGRAVATAHGPGCEAVTGYTAEHYAADPYLWLRMVDEEDRLAVLRQTAQVLAGEGPPPLEHRILHRDGSLRWIRNTPVLRRDPTGRLIAYDGIITNISERKRSEQRAAAEHGVTRILAESAGFLGAAPGILQAIAVELNWDVGLLWVLDGAAQVLRCSEAWQAPDAPVDALVQPCRRIAFARGQGIPGRAWTSGGPVWITDVAADAQFGRDSMQGLHGAAGFPIHMNGDFFGVMEFFSRRIRQRDEALLDSMASIGSQISQFSERRQAQEAVLRRDAELEVARAIQQGLHPKTVVTLPGFTIGGLSDPAQETGGDYFDLIPLPDGQLHVAIGDVSGHGIGAALIMAATRAYLRALALTHTDLDQILALANGRLAEDIGRDHFVTLCLARLDPRTRSLVYASAGHYAGYALDRQGEVKATLPSTGTPLGIAGFSDFPVAPPILLEPSELVLLLTDGIPDARAVNGEHFGLRRTLDLVRAHREESPNAILEALFQAVRDFSQPHLPEDDITALVIKAEAARSLDTA